MKQLALLLLLGLTSCTNTNKYELVSHNDRAGFMVLNKETGELYIIRGKGSPYPDLAVDKIDVVKIAVKK